MDEQPQKPIDYTQLVAELEARIAAVEKSNASQQTSIDATAQALAAMDLSRRNRTYLKELDRKLNAFICLGVGAGFIWLGGVSINPLIGQYAIGTGFGVTIWGIAVLTGWEKQVIAIASGVFERFFGRSHT